MCLSYFKTVLRQDSGLLEQVAANPLNGSCTRTHLSGSLGAESRQWVSDARTRTPDPAFGVIIG